MMMMMMMMTMIMMMLCYMNTVIRHNEQTLKDEKVKKMKSKK